MTNFFFTDPRLRPRVRNFYRDFQHRNPARPTGTCGRLDGSTRTCRCGKHYSRADALNRHLSNVKFKCTYQNCNAGSGNGFRRRDHLRQHLEVFHKLTKAEVDQLLATPDAFRV
ncbi:hypothetical protein B0T14DRAFT_508093 [Immersiella caudata]|uniref:C2H2-type domain-containing protein n=1 Tax=Immersiella caudata TaxID=314043 RepID=A0AA39XHY4_9PEZI|nr:hypothetical protein B0T14DRAFT_508093 [Immersiella caudata]